MVPLLVPQPGRDVPEADVGALRLWHDQIELLRLALEGLHLVPGQVHQMVDLLLKAGHSLITTDYNHWREGDHSLLYHSRELSTAATA